MEAVSNSEYSVNFYQTARRNNPEDSHLYTFRDENLKSHHEDSFLLSPSLICNGRDIDNETNLLCSKFKHIVVL
jgi:hypothetical protein